MSDTIDINRTVKLRKQKAEITVREFTDDNGNPYVVVNDLILGTIDEVRKKLDQLEKSHSEDYDEHGNYLNKDRLEDQLKRKEKSEPVLSNRALSFEDKEDAKKEDKKDK